MVVNKIFLQSNKRRVCVMCMCVCMCDVYVYVCNSIASFNMISNHVDVCKNVYFFYFFVFIIL